MGLSLGLVGLGAFGSVFAPLFKSHPLVDRIALCDAEADRIRQFSERDDFRDKLSPRDLYTSLDDICRSDVDALVIITQPWLHAPQCLQALEHGKSVYSAVPLISLPDMDEILDWCGKIITAVQASGKHYMLGETTVYHPETMFCRRKAAAGAFGDFVYAEGEYVHDLDYINCSLREVQRYRSTGSVGEKAAAFMQQYLDRGIKGSPMTYPTHSVSGPLAVMQTRARKVSARGYRNANQDDFFKHDEFSNVLAFFHLENGAALRIAECREFSYNIGCNGEDFRIFGTRGSYSLNEWRENGRVFPDGKPKDNVLTKVSDESMRDPLPLEVAAAFNKILKREAAPGDDFVPSGHRGSHPYLVHEFCSALSENRRPAIDAWTAAEYMAMGAAAHQSALRDGELVNVFDFGRPS